MLGQLQHEANSKELLGLITTPLQSYLVKQIKVTPTGAPYHISRIMYDVWIFSRILQRRHKKSIYFMQQILIFFHDLD